jgi:hypothetical protein
MISLGCVSSGAYKQFAESGGLRLLQFMLQKYAVQVDNSTMSLCALLSQVNHTFF